MDLFKGNSSSTSSAVLNMKDFPQSGFTDTKFTDLVIHCQGRKFHVHKVVLAQHSGFFNKACDPDSPWVEARTGEIQLDNDQPKIVQAMLEYCYRGEGFLDYTGDEGSKPEEVLMFDVLLHAMADQYQVVGLEEATFDRFLEELNCMLNDTQEISPACLGKIAREIFETTLETEVNFRKAILSEISTRIVTLRRSRRFNEQIHKIDGFWEFLSDFNAEAGFRGRYCPCCGEKQFQDRRSNYRKLVCCGACNTWHDLNAWNKRNGEMEPVMAPDADTEDESILEGPSKKRKQVD